MSQLCRKSYRGVSYAKRYGPRGFIETEEQCQRLFNSLWKENFKDFKPPTHMKKWKTWSTEFATDAEVKSLKEFEALSKSEQTSYVQNLPRNKEHREAQTLKFYDPTTAAGRKHRKERSDEMIAYYDPKTEEGRNNRKKGTEKQIAYYDPETEEGRNHREHAREKQIAYYDPETEAGRNHREHARDVQLRRWYPTDILNLLLVGINFIVKKCFRKLGFDRSLILKGLKVVEWPLIYLTSAASVGVFTVMFNPVPVWDFNLILKCPTISFLIESFDSICKPISYMKIGDMTWYAFPHAKAYGWIPKLKWDKSLAACLRKNIVLCGLYDSIFLGTGGCHDFGVISYFSNPTMPWYFGEKRSAEEYRLTFFQTLLSLYMNLIPLYEKNQHKELYFYGEVHEDGYFYHPLGAERINVTLTLKKGSEAAATLKDACEKTRKTILKLSL